MQRKLHFLPTMNTVRELKLMPVWVNPEHMALTALHVMLGHKLKALAVLEGTKLVGTVALESLLESPEGATVGSRMRPAETIIQAEMNVRDAARLFLDRHLDFAPVLDGERFLGNLTPVALLRELENSYDPLTKLSWSDRLREWGIEHLKLGDEVSIIFVDLDRFGLYNKKYGHIVGDKVIQKVAKFLTEQIDPALDVLVRYGGDEFAIGTLRNRIEADAMATLLGSRFQGDIAGADEPVSFSTGTFGGRRHRERENIHFAATIDNLINIASRNCTSNKKKPSPRVPVPEHEQVPVAEAVVEPREVVDEVTEGQPFRVLGIYTDDGAENGITTVIIGRDDEVYSGADTKGQKTIVESIASATAKAMERMTSGAKYEIAAIDLVQENGEQVVSITGRSRDGAIAKPVSAARRVSDDLASAVAEATIHAFL